MKISVVMSDSGMYPFQFVMVALYVYILFYNHLRDAVEQVDD